MTAACLLCMCCSLSACVPKKPAQQPPQTGFVPALPGNYDSIDTAVLVKKDTWHLISKYETVSFFLIDNGLYLAS